MSSKNRKSMFVVAFAVIVMAISQLACSGSGGNGGNTDQQIITAVQDGTKELTTGVGKAVDKIDQNLKDTGKLLDDACHSSNGSCK